MAWHGMAWHGMDRGPQMYMQHMRRMETNLDRFYAL
jgi:hypothetical protein